MKTRTASLFVALLAAGVLTAQAAPLSEILKKKPVGSPTTAQAAVGTVSTAPVALAAAVAGGVAAAAANDDETTTGTTGTTGTVQ